MYLDVDGLRHPRWPEVLGRADALFRRAREQARRSTWDPGAALEADLGQIRTWLDSGIDRSRTRGVAVFSSAADDFFETVELTTPVRDQIVVAAEPDVAQLCLASATSWSAIVVEVDSERGRVLRLEPGGQAEELADFDDELGHGIDTDRELAGFEHHQEELARDHFRRVARAVIAETIRRPVSHLVLFGPGKSLEELERHLPRHVGDRIAGRAPVRSHAGTAELIAAATEIVERVEEERRSAVLATLRQRATTTGAGAVTGLGPTLGSLGDGLVAILVVERSFEAAGGRCEDCRSLTVRARSCPRCGGPVRELENVVDAAIADAFLQHAAVDPVAQGSLSDLGRIGALLEPWAREGSGDSAEEGAPGAAEDAARDTEAKTSGGDRRA